MFFLRLLLPSRDGKCVGWRDTTFHFLFPTVKFQSAYGSSELPRVGCVGSEEKPEPTPVGFPLSKGWIIQVLLSESSQTQAAFDESMLSFCNPSKIWNTFKSLPQVLLRLGLSYLKKKLVLSNHWAHILSSLPVLMGKWGATQSHSPSERCSVWPLFSWRTLNQSTSK